MSLKLSEGFTRVGPIIRRGRSATRSSFVLLSKILERGMHLWVVYAIWSALGIAVIVIIDTFWFEERLSCLQIAGLLRRVVGIAALQLGSHPA